MDAAITRYARFLFFLFAVGVLFTPLGQAHPAVSVVMDSRGVVYYSDLQAVWMILPDGDRRVAVADVHTHELWLDAEDHLYGEDVTNIGEVYRHRVWVRAPDGAVSDVIPWRQGHPVDHDDYAFVRDDEGRSYVLRRAEHRIDVRRDNRVIRSISLKHLEGFPHWLTLDHTDGLLVGIGPAIYRIASDSDEPSLMASDLVERTEAFSFVQDRHALMGIWTDAQGNTFVAVFCGQVVKKITPEGTIHTVYRSEAGWSPTGGLAAPDGSLWLLETSTSNQVRVRRIAEDGSSRTY